MPELAAPIVAGQADMVLGSRLVGEIAPRAMPWHQRFGNRLAAWLIRRLYGLPLTDLSPFRAVNRDLLVGLELADLPYGWPTEMIVKAARRGWRVVETPVLYRPRPCARTENASDPTAHPPTPPPCRLDIAPLRIALQTRTHTLLATHQPIVPSV